MPPRPDISADRLIDALLRSLLDRTPGSASACLNLIDEAARHDLPLRPSNSIGRPTTAVGAQRPPSPDWNALLPSLRVGQSALTRAGAHQPDPVRPHATPAVLVCPAIGPGARLAGAVLIEWDANAGPPNGAELTDLMDAGTRAGRQIAAVLELREHALVCDRTLTPG